MAALCTPGISGFQSMCPLDPHKGLGLRQDSDYHVHLTDEKTGVGRLSDSSEILVCVCAELSLGPGAQTVPLLFFLFSSLS